VVLSLLFAVASSQITLFDFTVRNIDDVMVNFRRGYKAYYVTNVASK